MWFVTKRFQHNDKPITDFALIETSICVAAEDRRVSFINIQTGLLEAQVLRFLIQGSC